MRTGRIVALVCLLLNLDACSLLFVTPAPPFVQPGQPVECTDSHVFPWIDTLYGIAALSSAVGGGSTDSTSSTDKQVGVPILSLMAVGALASAYIGFHRTSRCADLEDAYAAAQARYPYPPPQQPYYPQQPPPQPPPYYPAPQPQPQPTPQPPPSPPR